MDCVRPGLYTVDHEPLMVIPDIPTLGPPGPQQPPPSPMVQILSGVQRDPQGDYRVAVYLCKHCGQIYTTTEDEPDGDVD